MKQEGQSIALNSSGSKKPWEISSDREKLEHEKTAKKQLKKEKSKSRRAKIKAWLKKHKILSVAMLLIILVIIGALIFLAVMFSKKEGIFQPEYTVGVVKSEGDDSKIKYQHLYDKYRHKMADVMLSSSNEQEMPPDIYKIEDNADSFIKTVDSEYEKIFYELAKIQTFSSFDKNRRSLYLLEVFNENKYQLDKEQRYAYLKACYSIYQNMKDSKKATEYLELLKQEFQ